MDTGTKAPLLAALRARLDQGAREWLDAAVAAARPDGIDALLSAYTLASRRVGNRPFDADRSALPSALVLDRWTLEDAARAALLLAYADVCGPDGFQPLATACYEQADAREQESWLRTVGVLPGPERFLPQVVDACRTSVLPVFEAVACENPYPAAFFPDLNFNQMILKALFNGVALARVVGLNGRRNPELARMAADYAAERRAAGRPVPADIALVTVDAGGSLR